MVTSIGGRGHHGKLLYHLFPSLGGVPVGRGGCCLIPYGAIRWFYGTVVRVFSSLGRFQSPTGQSGGSTLLPIDEGGWTGPVSIPYGAIRWFYRRWCAGIWGLMLVSIPYGAIRWFYSNNRYPRRQTTTRFNPLRGNPVVLLTSLNWPKRRVGMFQSPTGQSGGSTQYLHNYINEPIGFNPLRGNPVVLRSSRRRNKQ